MSSFQERYRTGKWGYSMKGGRPVTEVEMRGLTLTQPWASLLACGFKRIETRSWKTEYRGLVAIHAAAGLGGLSEFLVGRADARVRTPREEDLAEVCDSSPFAELLELRFGARLMVHEDEPTGAELAAILPRGKVVAVARLTGCLWTGRRLAPGPHAVGEAMDLGLMERLVEATREGRPEEELGNYSPARWAWVFEEIQELPEPVEARYPRFKRGLWDVSGGLLHELYETYEGLRPN